MSQSENPTVIADVVVTLDEWLAGYQLARRRDPTRWIIPAMSAVVACWAALVHDWVLAIVFAALTVGYDGYVAHHHRELVRKRYSDAVSVKLTTWGVETTTPLRRGELSWALFDEVIETSSWLVVRSSRDVAVIPKLALTDDQRDAIQAAFGRTERWHFARTT